MNLCGGKFVPSDVRATTNALATKEIGAEKMAALKQAYKSAAVDAAIMSAIDEFEPGVLNEEELAWAAQDPELAELLAMCSQKELERMREDRAYKAARAQ